MRKCLLVLPGDELLTKVVTINPVTDMNKVLNSTWVQRWPDSYKLAEIKYKDITYRYDIWVDEEAQLKNLELNLCATLAAHPLNEFHRRYIYGPAILVAKKDLTLDDWHNIGQATYYDEDEVERNCTQ